MFSARKKKSLPYLIFQIEIRKKETKIHSERTKNKERLNLKLKLFSFPLALLYVLWKIVSQNEIF